MLWVGEPFVSHFVCLSVNFEIQTVDDLRALEERLINLSRDETDCTPLVLKAVCALAPNRNLLIRCFLRAKMHILKLKEGTSCSWNAYPRVPAFQGTRGVGTASSASGVAGGVEKPRNPGDNDDVHCRHSFFMWNAPHTVTGIRDSFAVFVPPGAYSLTVPRFEIGPSLCLSEQGRSVQVDEGDKGGEASAYPDDVEGLRGKLGRRGEEEDSQHLAVQDPCFARQVTETFNS
jgi:hypothetical protein